MNAFQRYVFAAKNFRNYARSLSRRAAVEADLLDMANGKKDLPSREECRKMAFRLAGCEAEIKPKG